MANIKGFTFYDNYFELIDNLDDKNKKIMAVAILDYMFKDINPNLTGLNKAIWMNISMPLAKSKAKSKSGQSIKQSENEKETKQNRNENEIKTKGVTNNISTFIFLISNFNYLKDKRLLREKIEEWLKYKWERKEYYKQTGFNTLLKQIEKHSTLYGEDKMVALIDECMSNNYKGIIFDKLIKYQNQKQEVIPNWFNKEIKREEIELTDEEREILKRATY